MAEINLLRRYPRAKRNIEKRTGAQSETNIRIARRYGRDNMPDLISLLTNFRARLLREGWDGKVES